MTDRGRYYQTPDMTWARDRERRSMAHTRGKHEFQRAPDLTHDSMLASNRHGDRLQLRVRLRQVDSACGGECSGRGSLPVAARVQGLQPLPRRLLAPSHGLPIIIWYHCNYAGVNSTGKYATRFLTTAPLHSQSSFSTPTHAGG